jgi:hypothetical protein
MRSSESTRRRWLACLLSTEPADRPQVEAAIRTLYVAAGLEAPRRLCWFDSPGAACWAVAVLLESRRTHWAEILAGARRSAADRERIEQVRAALSACCARPAWEAVVADMGPPLGMRMQYPPQLPAGMIQPAIITARLKLYGGDVASFPVSGTDDVLHNAEHALWGRDGAVLTSNLYCPTVGTLLSQCTSTSPEAEGLLGMLNRLRGALGQQRRRPAQPPQAASRPYVPPDPRAGKLIRRMEKRTGALPLSIRAFYEIVGAVDFNGVHPSLTPPEASTCPDPLIVYGPDDVLAELDGWQDEDRPSQIAVAPDDLHKAGASGGDGYAIAVPDARADGELLNERHNLFFVDYLRLCFDWGGFPGYEGLDRDIPPEIEGLRSGLIAF